MFIPQVSQPFTTPRQPGNTFDDDNAVFHVTTDAFGHDLYVCLDDENDDTLKGLARLWSEDIFVCLDSTLTGEAKQ